MNLSIESRAAPLTRRVLQPGVRRMLTTITLMVVVVALWSLPALFRHWLLWLYPDAAAQPELWEDVDRTSRALRLILLVVAALAVGLAPIARFPANGFRASYRKWLAATPWQPGLPLPLGSPLPTPATAAWLGLLTILAWQGNVPVQLPVVVAVLAYAGGGGFATEKFRRIPQLLVLAIACIVFLRSCVYGLGLPQLMVLGGVGALAFWYMRDLLEAMARLEDQPFEPPDILQQRTSRVRILVQAPTLRISPMMGQERLATSNLLLLALTVGLGVECAARYLMMLPDASGRTPDRHILFISAMILSFIALIVVSQTCIGYRRPVSLLTSLRTGRLFEPWDRILLMPAIAIATAWLLPLLLRSVGLPLSLAVGFTAGLEVVIVGRLGPSRGEWHLCGDHRIVYDRPRGRSVPVHLRQS